MPTTRQPPLLAAVLLALSACLNLVQAGASGALAACKDAASCQAHVDSLVGRLVEMKGEMRSKQLTLTALEDLRTGVLTGKRVELPSAQRQHLERGSPVISEVTFDARHRPISTNVSRHFRPLITIAETAEVHHHAFLTLKRSPSGKAGTTSLLVTVDSLSTLSVWDVGGEALLLNYDLGHGEGRTVSHLALSPNNDAHFVISADDQGVVRVHDLKIVGQKDRKDKSGDEDDEDVKPKEPWKRQMKISSSFSCTFSLLPSTTGEPRRLTSIMPVDRGAQPWFVAGDSSGGISVFFRNGTLKGRVKVSEDPGGVQGLLRSQGQMILYYSSHSFGYFSPAQIEVQYPPCTGWNSPLFDVATDPTNAASRVVLALSDGDIVVFSTSQGKSKTCDLTLKFPHVSPLPFKLHAFKGHIMALPTPLRDTPRKSENLGNREIFVFNIAAMDAGYGLTPSRAVALQASFKPRQPDSLVLMASSMGPQDRSKGHVAIRFEGVKGIEVFELNLKQPPPPKSATGGGEGGEESSWSSWLNWFPKIGVFGIALIGVVFWNVRKVTSQPKNDRGMDDFDDEVFRERLRERREKRAVEQGGAVAGGGGEGLGMGGGGAGSRGGGMVEEVRGGDDD